LERDESKVMLSAIIGLLGRLETDRLKSYGPR